MNEGKPMKKVLFATTALVASAGIASAEVVITGFAEMGIIGGDRQDPTTALDETATRFHHDIDIKFALSGETDNGLTFGATIDLDEVSGGISNEANPASVYISGNFGTLTMGDTDGAFDWAMSEVAIGSAINDDHTAHGGYNGNSIYDGDHDGQIARYDYSFGDFAFAVSAEIDDSDAAAPGTGAKDGPTFQIGGRYSGDIGGVNLAVGLGWGQSEIGGNTQEEVGISIRAKFAGGFEAIFNYTDLGDSDRGGVSEEHMAIGLGYSMDALTIGVNWGEFTEGASTQDGYGLAVNYDLGGGAVAQFGYGSTQSCGVFAGCNTGDTFSLGLAMSF